MLFKKKMHVHALHLLPLHFLFVISKKKRKLLKQKFLHVILFNKKILEKQLKKLIIL
jgi:hypothetical protein